GRRPAASPHRHARREDRAPPRATRRGDRQGSAPSEHPPSILSLCSAQHVIRPGRRQPRERSTERAESTACVLRLLATLALRMRTFLCAIKDFPHAEPVEARTTDVQHHRPSAGGVWMGGLLEIAPALGGGLGQRPAPFTLVVAADGGGVDIVRLFVGDGEDDILAGYGYAERAGDLQRAGLARERQLRVAPPLRRSADRQPPGGPGDGVLHIVLDAPL